MALAQSADPRDNRPLGIAEVAERTGTSAHTLRYYERAGLVRVPRDESGRRAYGEAEVARVVFLTIMRAAAMPIRELLAYVRLADAGPGTEAERYAILERHRQRVADMRHSLDVATELIEAKLDLYHPAALGAPGAAC